MSLESFYNNPDLADGFNIWPHSWRSQPHRGLDFAKATGTSIPSVNAGVVVISEWNPYLGNIVEVKGDDGVFMGYCHMNKPGLAVGTRVLVGSTIGPVGNTGSQSNGSHLHITKGDRQGAVRGASISYLSDPWPYIKAAINNPTPNTPSGEEEDEEMARNIGTYIGGDAKTPADKRVCAVYNPESGFLDKWSGADQTYINQRAQAYGTGNFIRTTQKHWDQVIAPMLAKIAAK